MTRLVALLLVPCLLADPALASVLEGSLARPSGITSSCDCKARFDEQTLILAGLCFLAAMDSSATAETWRGAGHLESGLFVSSFANLFRLSRFRRKEKILQRIVIGPPTHEDVNSMLALRRLAFQHKADAEDSEPIFIDEVTRCINGDSGIDALVAKLDGKIIAQWMARKLGDDAVQIGEGATHPAYRKLGISTELFRRILIEVERWPGIRQIFVDDSSDGITGKIANKFGLTEDLEVPKRFVSHLPTAAAPSGGSPSTLAFLWERLHPGEVGENIRKRGPLELVFLAGITLLMAFVPSSLWDLHSLWRSVAPPLFGLLWGLGHLAGSYVIQNGKIVVAGARTSAVVRRNSVMKAVAAAGWLAAVTTLLEAVLHPELLSGSLLALLTRYQITGLMLIPSIALGVLLPVVVNQFWNRRWVEMNAHEMQLERITQEVAYQYHFNKRQEVVVLRYLRGQLTLHQAADLLGDDPGIQARPIRSEMILMAAWWTLHYSLGASARHRIEYFLISQIRPSEKEYRWKTFEGQELSFEEMNRITDEVALYARKAKGLSRDEVVTRLRELVMKEGALQVYAVGHPRDAIHVEVTCDYVLRQAGAEMGVHKSWTDMDKGLQFIEEFLTRYTLAGELEPFNLLGEETYEFETEAGSPQGSPPQIRLRVAGESRPITSQSILITQSWLKDSPVSAFISGEIREVFQELRDRLLHFKAVTMNIYSSRHRVDFFVDPLNLGDERYIFRISVEEREKDIFAKRYVVTGIRNDVEFFAATVDQPSQMLSYIDLMFELVPGWPSVRVAERTIGTDPDPGGPVIHWDLTRYQVSVALGEELGKESNVPGPLPLEIQGPFNGLVVLQQLERKYSMPPARDLSLFLNRQEMSLFESLDQLVQEGQPLSVVLDHWKSKYVRQVQDLVEILKNLMEPKNIGAVQVSFQSQKRELLSVGLRNPGVFSSQQAGTLLVSFDEGIRQIQEGLSKSGIHARGYRIARGSRYEIAPGLYSERLVVEIEPYDSGPMRVVEAQALLSPDDASTNPIKEIINFSAIQQYFIAKWTFLRSYLDRIGFAQMALIRRGLFASA